MEAEPLCLMRKTTTQLSLSFGIEMGGYQTFQGVPVLLTHADKTDNNPLTYIMTTLNLDATSHWCVGALVQFNFKLEYQKGCDNTVVDVLSQVTTQLDPDTVRSILNGVALGAVHWVKVHNPTMVESDHHLEEEVMCCCRPHACTDACNDLGQSQKRGPSAECSSRLAEGPEEDRFKSSSGRTHLKQGRPNDLMESTKFCDSLGSLIFVLNAQGWDQGFTTVWSP